MAKLSSTQIFGDLVVDGEIKNKATTTTEGVVKLNDAINSTSTTQGATANAVKKVNDSLASHVSNTTSHITASERTTWNNKLDKTGGTMTGKLKISSASPTGIELIPTDNVEGKGAEIVFASTDNQHVRIRANHYDSIRAPFGFHLEKCSPNTQTGKAYLQVEGEIFANNGSKVYHEGNKPTPTDIGASPTSHTHNYAGSSSAGGSATSALTCTGNSATATTLQTARTINGTSFNGSANITTANWGTARTITIGSTGKSVNGSGNVSWSLSEIGAAAASHTHNYAGSSSAGGAATSALACTGNSATATKLATARYIGKATFDGSGNIELYSIAGRANISSSGSDKANKYSKFATINVSGGTYRCCSGTLEFTASEASTFYGELSYYFRTGSAITSTSIDLKWRTLTNSSYATRVYAVKVSDGKYDLYYQPISTWDSMTVTNTNSVGSSYITLYSSQGYVDSITIAATSSLSGYVSNAATATTLATARTINGTSFNGSANITTANWGTARTITIGNTGKSVNGSANVSWSLSEIGAAASSHTHNYAGSSSAGGAATSALACTGNSATATTSNYLASNTRMDYGWNGINYFNINGTAGTAAKANNTPTTAWWHVMRFNHANSTGYYTDLAIPFNDVSMYYKRITSGAVQNGGWIKILDALNYTSYVPTKTGSGASGTWGISITGNSATATKLATARTINGTNFDGSANITTANWGTARTITIGNTGKSVNGSANVSWSHAELGTGRAYSASYSFGSAQTAMTTAEFITLISGLGAFSQPYWVCRGSWSYASNRYISDTGCGNIHLAGCTVEVMGTSSAYTIRIHTPTTSANGVTNGDFIYINNGTSYSPGWRRLYSTAYKPTPADIGAIPTSASCNKNWHWSGQGGQPTWLWGGIDGTNMYVYNPSNFSVNYANSAGNADTVDGYHASSFAPSGYGLGESCRNLSGGNWNDALKTGFYMGNGMANSPNGNTDWWIGHVLNHHDGWVIQRVCNFNSSQQWFTRYKLNGSWTGWTNEYDTKITKSTGSPSGGYNGDVWIKYS